MISDLVAFLGQTGAISALVSTRIYPVTLPQKPTYPNLLFSQVSGVPTYGLEGDLGKVRTRMQIDCRATTHKVAHQLADEVRHALSGFQGSMSGTQVHCITLDNQFDNFDDEASVTGVYRVTQDYIISHLED